MSTFLAYVKMFAPVVAAVVTALTPFYGKYHWFIAAVAGVSALTLAAPSILPSSQSTGQKGG